MTDKSKNPKPQGIDPNKIKNLDQIKEFFKNLQCGDIQLNKPITYGISLYGETKIGKTSACHCLALSPLKGKQLAGQIKFVTTTNNFKTALIGNEGNSQTQIPNFFDLKLQQNGHNITLIDTPGYGDSYGVYRILSNAFFHYRLYSKVQNMKFIITFDRNHLKNTAQKVIKTIQNFTYSFKNYNNQQQRNKIWNSAAFLITKVQNGQNQLKNIKQKFISLADTLKTQLNKQDDMLFRQFLRYMVKQNKIFIIQQAIQNKSPDFTGLMDKINKSIKTWWKRQIIKETVDMLPINFCIGKSIQSSLYGQNSQFAKSQFVDLIIYMNYRSKHYLSNSKGSIKNFLKQIGQDAIKAPSSHNFLNLMKGFVDQNYSFKKEYLEKRNQLQRQLFEYNTDNPQNSNSNMSTIKTIRDKQKQAYLIKKFKVLQFVQKIKSQINKNQSSQKRNVQTLDFASERIYQLIKLLNTIKFMKDDSKEIIYKYGYLIHRMMQESKIFILLIEGDQNNNYKKSLFHNDISKDPNFKQFQIHILLKDIMGQDNVDGEPLAKLKEKYIIEFDFSNTDIALTQSLIDFFTSMKVTDNKIARNIIQLVSRYSGEVINKKKKNNLTIEMQEAKRMIKRLYICRQQCDYLILQSKNQTAVKETQELTMLLRSLSKQLGYLLEQIKYFSEAKLIYESIYFVDKVLCIYQQLIEQEPEKIQLRIEYAVYASQHSRQSMAIQILQKAYQLAIKYQDLQDVKKTMMNIITKSKTQDLSQKYSKQLYNDNFYQPFNYAIQNAIKKVTEDENQSSKQLTPK